MTEKTLIELTCSGCEKAFHVYLVPRTVLCAECQAFKAAMDNLMQPREWERKPGVDNEAYKGLGIGLLLTSALLGACWFIVSWLRW